jgi:hypothetical protein
VSTAITIPIADEMGLLWHNTKYMNLPVCCHARAQSGSATTCYAPNRMLAKQRLPAICLVPHGIVTADGTPELVVGHSVQQVVGGVADDLINGDDLTLDAVQEACPKLVPPALI